MNACARHMVAEDDLVRDLAGDLIHVFHVTTIARPDSVERVRSALACATVESMRTSRCGGNLQHRLTLTGLDPAAARDLAGRLSDVSGIHYVTVEHLIARRGLP